MEALADYLVKDALGGDPDAMRWGLLELDGIDAEDRAVSALVDHLARAGC